MSIDFASSEAQGSLQSISGEDANPKNVLYIAENALSSIQGGGIVAYAVLKGLPPENLLGLFEYRHITPLPEYADRFAYSGTMPWPRLFHSLNRLTSQRFTKELRVLMVEAALKNDFESMCERIEQEGFKPEVVYFAGLSFRFLKIALMLSEHFDIPMLVLHMDDWIALERKRWGEKWHQLTIKALKRAAQRSLANTTNSPRLAKVMTELTGYVHEPANNCCSDLMVHATDTFESHENEIPVITYAGAMHTNLQGESLKILAAAVTELNAEGTPVHLHIYTTWQFAPDANSISVPNAVFYKGQVGRESLADIFRKSDFLVTTVTQRDSNITLFRHSLSTKLSEYLCCGKPVISMGHYDWHMHEYVEENNCGFTIPIDVDFSRAQIKKKIQQILATNPDKLSEIGRQNRQLWEKAHDVKVMARATRQVVGLPIE